MRSLKVFFNRIIHFYVNLIKSDTGYNSKTFVMVWGVVMITLVLLMSILLIFLAAHYSWTIPWLEFASFITQLSTLQGVLIWGKVKSEENETHRNNDYENE